MVGLSPDGSHEPGPPDGWRGPDAIPALAVLGAIVLGLVTGSHPLLGAGIFTLGLLSLIWSVTKRDDRLRHFRRSAWPLGRLMLAACGIGARILFTTMCCGMMALGIDGVVTG
jgi:hypothetical protein